MNLFRKIKGFTLVEIMIVVAIIGILIAIAVPGFIRARSQSRLKSCQENLTKIDGAKEQWALERNKRPGDPCDMVDLVTAGGTGYLKTEPLEPSGYFYIVNAIGQDPICTSPINGHTLQQIGEVVTTVE